MKKTLFEITGISSRVILICGVSLLTLPLVGCNLYEEGNITTSRVQVEEKQFSRDMLVSEMNDAYIDELARHFYKYGGGVMDVTVTYDPYSRSNTAMSAGNSVSDIVSSLRKAGVRDLKGGVLPVKNQGDAARVLIEYASYTAHAPEGCDDLPGIEGRTRDLEYDASYKYGCSMQALIAKQVARPKDLLGQENTDYKTDGRAAANVVDNYRQGTPNKPLEGETASER